MLRSIFSVLLIGISLRDYLFGNGLFIYRDWSWPLSTGLTPFAVFSPQLVRNAGPDPLGFTRMFLNWPIVLIDNFTQDPIIAEKVFIIYLYTVLVFLSFILAEVLLRVLNRFNQHPLSNRRGQIFILFVVLFSFANLWSLQQFSDFYYTYMYGLMVTGICVGTIILRDAGRRSIILSGALISTLGFLAPEVYPFGWLAIAIVVLRVTLSQFPFYRALKRSAVRVAILVGVNIPVILTALYIFSVTLGTSLRPVNSYGFSVSFLSPDNAIRLLGYAWSLITYAPPSIAASNTSISQLSTQGVLPFMVSTGDIVSTFWLVTTWLVPVFSFSALLIRRFWRVTIPTATAAAVGLLLTQPVIFPIPHLLAVVLEGQPVLGGAIATVLAISDHVLIMVASAYVILIATVSYQLLSSGLSLGQNLRNNLIPLSLHIPSFPTPEARGEANSAIIVGALILLLFPGWQFFSGSFYPAGYTNGISGNGVPSTGTFSPVHPPQGMTEAYNWLQSQPGDFNIYWPGPDGGAAYPWSEKGTPSIGYVDSPKPTIQNWVLNPTPFPAALKYLVQANLTADIRPYLDALNVRYLVVQPLSESAMSSVWGVTNATLLTRLFESAPGLNLAYATGDVSVFTVNGNWGSTYAPGVVASYSNGDNSYGIAYGLFASMGTRLALINSDQGNSLCFDSLACSLSVESPGYVGTTLISEPEYATLNRSGVSLSSFAIPAENVTWLPKPWSPWTLANWGPRNATVSIDNGSMHWTYGPGSTLLSLSYNGTVTDHNPGGISIPSGEEATVLVSFQYRTSTSFTSSIQVGLPLLDSKLGFFAEPASSPLPPSAAWREGNFSITLPVETSVFTARIQAQASSGWLELKDVTVRISFLRPDRNAFFGQVLPFTINRAYQLTVPEGYVYMEYLGNGTATCNNQQVSLESPSQLSWTRIGPCSNQPLQLVGVTMGAILVAQGPLPMSRNDSSKQSNSYNSLLLESPSSVIVARMFAPGYTLANPTLHYQPSRTLDGMMLFVNVQPGSYTVEFPPENIALTAYLTTLIFSALIILSPTRIIRIANRIRRPRSVPNETALHTVPETITAR